jgi:hypothetical protein
MNYWRDTHAYQQSNKISPFSATVCVSDSEGTDVSVSVGEDGGGIRSVARDSAQTRAAEHRRVGVSLPVGAIRAVDLIAQAARTQLCRTQLSEPKTLPQSGACVPLWTTPAATLTTRVVKVALKAQ